MKFTRPDLAAYVVVLVCVVGVVVLTALHVPVPEFLTFAGTTALGVGGGVALQNSASSAASSPEPMPSPAALVAPAAVPAPAMPWDPSATGVMRPVTHAP